MNAGIERELRWAVELLYSCKAIATDVVTVHHKIGHDTIWFGKVTVFTLDGYPTAKQAYAWYSERPGTGKREFYSALHAGAVRTPLEAVCATLGAVRK